MKPIQYHRLALREYGAEARYYNGKQAGQGIDFQQEIAAAERRIQSSPRLFPVYGTTSSRGCSVHRYPFTLYFCRVRRPRCHFYAVVHHRRRPGYWLRRLTT